MASDPNSATLTTATKEVICDWIKTGSDHLKQNKEIVKKSFLVCGISNSLDGSENQFICCAKELPDMQLPYGDESSDDPFQSSDDDTDEYESD